MSRPFSRPIAATAALRTTGRLHRLILLPACCTLLAAGCASPGPPKPPSLQIPQPVRDLSASREGAVVDLRFTLPQRTTDGAGLRPPQVLATLCRALDHDPCTPVSGFESLPLSTAPQAGKPSVVHWRDSLPPALTSADPRVLRYQVRLANLAGHSADNSNPAFTLAGTAPPRIEGLHAQGTREGVLLSWSAASSTAEVLVHREFAAAPVPSSKRETSLWLRANDTANTTHTLDTSAEPDVEYRYSAVRRLILQLGAHTLEMRSAPSAPLLFTLRDIFPPPAPAGLTAAAFGAEKNFAVDLIWEPVQDARLAGYNVTRQALDPQGQPLGAPVKLNSAPVSLPAFHDATADGTVRYRYSVTAIDAKGNESAAATTVLEPSQP